MDILMPQLGETVADGTVSQWFKSVGDEIAAGDPLFEIETDKTSMEVEATSSGVLTEIRVPAGETVLVGTPVAILTTGSDAASPESGAKTPAAKSSPDTPAAVAPVAATPVAATPVAAPTMPLSPFEEVRTPGRNFGPAIGPLDLPVTPLARRLASQNGVDLGALAADVKQRGGRRIAKADVLAAQDKASPASAGKTARRPAVSTADADIVPLNRIRRTTAQRLAGAWTTVPHVLQAVEVDFHQVDRARRALNAEGGDVRLSYLPFIARAVCLAIRDYPRVNATLDGDNLVIHKRVHLGIAVDLAHEGLLVPVIHSADDLTLIGIARAIADRVEKARAGKLGPDELSGSTYSISNSGSFGTLITAPIVNPPEVAILSSDGVFKKPVVVEDDNGGDAIAVRPVGVLAQSFDHRAFDGAYSAAFLKRIKEILETTDWIANAR